MNGTKKDKKCQYACEPYRNLKKKEKRSVNMVVNDTKIFQRMSIEIFFLEYKR